MTPLECKHVWNNHRNRKPHTKNDTLVAAILLSKLGPDALELSIGRATLSDDAAVPAGVVVLHIS